MRAKIDGRNLRASATGWAEEKKERRRKEAVDDVERNVEQVQME